MFQQSESAFGDGRVFIEKYIKMLNTLNFRFWVMEQTQSISGKDSVQSREGTRKFWKKDHGWMKILETDGTKSSRRRDISWLFWTSHIRVSQRLKREFYFLEVNPRVQVEHTVTEQLTGFDLVSLGIRVASGESIGISQDQIQLTGHAIQARVNAEKPTDFSPAPGRLWECLLPSDQE